jgi:hypothetical protein
MTNAAQLRLEASKLADQSALLIITQAFWESGRVGFARLRSGGSPLNRLEADYVTALHNYVRHKITANRLYRRKYASSDWHWHSGRMIAWRDVMTKIEAGLCYTFPA